MRELNRIKMAVGGCSVPDRFSIPQGVRTIRGLQCLGRNNSGYWVNPYVGQTQNFKILFSMSLNFRAEKFLTERFNYRVFQV